MRAFFLAVIFVWTLYPAHSEESAPTLRRATREKILTTLTQRDREIAPKSIETFFEIIGWKRIKNGFASHSVDGQSPSVGKVYQNSGYASVTGRMRASSTFTVYSQSAWVDGAANSDLEALVVIDTDWEQNTLQLHSVSGGRNFLLEIKSKLTRESRVVRLEDFASEALDHPVKGAWHQHPDYSRAQRIGSESDEKTLTGSAMLDAFNKFDSDLRKDDANRPERLLKALQIRLSELRAQAAQTPAAQKAVPTEEVVLQAEMAIRSREAFSQLLGPGLASRNKEAVSLVLNLLCEDLLKTK